MKHSVVINASTELPSLSTTDCTGGRCCGNEPITHHIKMEEWLHRLAEKKIDFFFRLKESFGELSILLDSKLFQSIP